MQIVKVFKSGNSQAIRIPKEYAVEDSELFIHRVGKNIILTSKHDVWASFRDSINGFSHDLFLEGREQPELQVREDF